jgi:hypothetical protein
VMVSGLAVAGQASAHDGGAVVGALIGGALLGAIVGSAMNPAPPVVYQAPAYAPVYQAAPAYAAYQAPAYAGPPPGYCYDHYRGAYVACSPVPAGPYGYAPPPQPGW